MAAAAVHLGAASAGHLVVPVDDGYLMTPVDQEEAAGFLAATAVHMLESAGYQMVAAAAGPVTDELQLFGYHSARVAAVLGQRSRGQMAQLLLPYLTAGKDSVGAADVAEVAVEEAAVEEAAVEEAAVAEAAVAEAAVAEAAVAEAAVAEAAVAEVAVEEVAVEVVAAEVFAVEEVAAEEVAVALAALIAEVFALVG
jgi:hypothetical protein